MSDDTMKLSRCERLSLWLIHRAARHAPSALAERLEEEWLADFETRRSSRSKLRFALGCLWATRVIAREYQPVMAGAAPVGNRLFSGELQNGFGRFSKRTSTLLIVASLHCALFYVAFTSLSHTHSAKPAKGMQIDPVRPPVKNPAPDLPQPRVDTVAVFHPEFADLPIPVDHPQAQDFNVIPAAVPEGEPRRGGGLALLPTPDVTRVGGGPGPGFPNPDDYYPSISKPLGEVGAAAVRVCVNRSGRLMGNPTILTTSGTDRLDQAALRLAKAGSGHYRPDSEDGRPLESCFAFRIRFQIKH